MDTDRRPWLARSILGLVMSVVATFVAPALAQRGPCHDDLMKFCPDAKPASPEARKCLTDNLDKLSEPCRQRVGAVRGRQQGYPARFKGCEGDLEKFCKDVMPGAGRLIKCLREHESELSAECRTRLPAGRGGGGRGMGRGGGGGGMGQGGGGGGAGKGSGQTSGTAAPAQPTVQAK